MFKGKKIISIKKIKEDRDVYDIEVKDAHHYLFGNGIVSHNSGPYAGNEQSGGSGSKYASSITINLTKAKDKDGDDHVGNVVTCTNVKSRITKEGLKVKTRIRFSGGLDRYYGLLDLAEKYGIFKKVSTKFELPDGRKIFGKTIERKPEQYFTEEILEQINKAVKEDFKYGVGQDEQFIEEELENEDK